MAAEGLRWIYTSGDWEVDLGGRELRSGGVHVPIGSRAFEIIEALVRSAGRLVTKDDLMGHVWPGMSVEENTLQVHIHAIRKALGPHRGMLRTASGRGYRLLGNWTVKSNGSHNSSAAVDNLPEATQWLPGNVPLVGSELIGRTSALQELCDLLSAYRLVTLTGPGGIGKTRLAIDTARALLPEFHGDGFFVELAQLSDASLVPFTIATVLRLDFGGADISPATVARAIGRKHLLLVLDNCEHIIDEAARQAEMIVRMCPRVSILTTSREMLRIEGEYAYRVPPLDVPPPSPPARGAVAVEHSAVTLFIARIAAQNSRLSLSHADLATIGAICRRLDGIPLAIELAAARAATLGIKYVADGLDDLFSLLTKGRRTALPRHQTLRATLDWSFKLLTEGEQTCLHRLAVFAGGFTIEAATAIISDTDMPPHLVATSIGNLVTKSLVAIDGADEVLRWRLLETTRAYAREKLRQSGAEHSLAQRHAEYFRDVCRGAAPGVGASPVLLPLAFYRREIDNIRAALDWAFASGGDISIGVALTVAAIPMWCQLSLLAECRNQVERALNSLELIAANARLRLELTAALGFAMTNSTGLIHETSAVLESALDLAMGLEDTDYQLRALWSIWTVRFNNGEIRKAREIADNFITLATRIGNDADVLVGKRLLGIALHYSGDQSGARLNLETMLRHYRAEDRDQHRIRLQFDQCALARAVLSRVLWLQGLADQALHLVHSNVEDVVAGGHVLSICYVLAEGACPVALMARDLAAAERYVAMLLDLSARHELPFWESWGRCLEAQLVVLRGDSASGSQALITAIAAFRAGGWATRVPDFLGACGTALGLDGRLLEGIAMIDSALALAGQEGERWSTAELLRDKGELILRSNMDDANRRAEELFLDSRKTARRHGALTLELRAVVSLARLGRTRGDVDALAPLAFVYTQFTEGYETADLREARELLASS